MNPITIKQALIVACGLLIATGNTPPASAQVTPGTEGIAADQASGTIDKKLVPDDPLGLITGLKEDKKEQVPNPNRKKKRKKRN